MVDRRRRDAARARGRRRRHLAHVPDQGRADPGLGPARRVARARATGAPAVFWLDETRAHDAAAAARRSARRSTQLDTDGLQIEILDVAEATRFTLERARAGEDTISVTGNVLRDYLTDLFPILELGTSAKMLSIVPLMNGGGLFETGAGGSAPKHVQQFLPREPPALGLARRVPGAGGRRSSCSPTRPATRARELLGARRSTGRPAACSRRTARPSRKVGELDNRGSHFYLALYWAQELADADRGPGAGRALRAAGRAPGRPTRRRSSPSWPRSRARRSTSAATTAPIRARGGGDAPERDAQPDAGQPVARARGRRLDAPAQDTGQTSHSRRGTSEPDPGAGCRYTRATRSCPAAHSCTEVSPPAPGRASRLTTA